MKYLLSASFLFLLCANLQAQIYLPDGTPYKGTGTTLAALSQEFEEHGRVYLATPFSGVDDNTTTVAFKLFTDEPLYVLTADSTKVSAAIAAFDLVEFLHSWEFENTLEEFIKRGTLSDVYILRSLGKPDKRSRYFDKTIQFEHWSYNDIGVILKFKNGIVQSYVAID